MQATRYRHVSVIKDVGKKTRFRSCGLVWRAMFKNIFANISAHGGLFFKFFTSWATEAQVDSWKLAFSFALLFLGRVVARAPISRFVCPSGVRPSVIVSF